MIRFRVTNMTCAHCVGAITRALAAVDEHAKVGVDLARGLVLVDTRDPRVEALRAAIADAGYAVALLEDAESPNEESRSASCCCRQSPARLA
jgi:copper chaperone